MTIYSKNLGEGGSWSLWPPRLRLCNWALVFNASTAATLSTQHYGTRPS